MKIKLPTRSILLSIVFSLSLLLFPLVSYSLTPLDVPNPQATYRGWVTDMANILSENAKNTLNQQISDLETDKGVEIAIVTVDNTQTRATPKEFTTELFNHWGIGKEGMDNGILFLVSIGDRRVEIETGYGMEGILPDARVGDIIDTQIIPNFREGDYQKGILDGTRAIIEAINVSYEFETLDTRSRIYSPNYFLPLLSILVTFGGGFLMKKEKTKLDKPVYLKKGITSRVSITEKYPTSALLTFCRFIVTVCLGFFLNFLLFNSIFQSSFHLNLHNSLDGFIKDAPLRFLFSFQLILICWGIFCYLLLSQCNSILEEKQRKISFSNSAYIYASCFIFAFANILFYIIFLDAGVRVFVTDYKINVLLVAGALMITIVLILPLLKFSNLVTQSLTSSLKLILILSGFLISFLVNWLLLNVIAGSFYNQFLFCFLILSVIYFVTSEFIFTTPEERKVNLQDLKNILISASIFFTAFTLVVVSASAFIWNLIQNDGNSSSFLDNLIIIMNNIFSYLAFLFLNNQPLANLLNSNSSEIIFIGLSAILGILSINIFYENLQKIFTIKEVKNIRFYADESKDIGLEKIPSEKINILLTKPESVAQKIGSIDIEAWVIPERKNKDYQREDLHIRIYTRQNSKFKYCPHCQELTMIRTSKVTKSATTYSTGIEKITTSCHCCDYEEIEEKIIPMVVVSSYSSSSGGSSGSSGGGGSFGGGSSGGGGAGGSW
ncbi:MAG: TPM domain-containing protein [Cyanobacterium sp.]